MKSLDGNALRPVPHRFALHHGACTRRAVATSVCADRDRREATCGEYRGRRGAVDLAASGGAKAGAEVQISDSAPPTRRHRPRGRWVDRGVRRRFGLDRRPRSTIGHRCAADRRRNAPSFAGAQGPTRDHRRCHAQHDCLHLQDATPGVHQHSSHRAQSSRDRRPKGQAGASAQYGAGAQGSGVVP